MAKITEAPAAAEQAAPELAQELLNFRDKVYTSRTLITPTTGRTLSVAKGLVQVLPADTEAVSFLKTNEEFELLKE